MKKKVATFLLWIAILFMVMMAFVSCNEQEQREAVQPTIEYGCQKGVFKQTGKLLLIRCCTYEQHLAGSNVNAGGTASFPSFTSVTWTKVKDCSECK